MNAFFRYDFLEPKLVHGRVSELSLFWKGIEIILEVARCLNEQDGVSSFGIISKLVGAQL